LALLFQKDPVRIQVSFFYLAEICHGIFPTYMKYPLIVIITTLGWLLVTFITPPENKKTLLNFYKKIKPAGPGWICVSQGYKRQKESISSGIIEMLIATIGIYSLLFATGYFIYGVYDIAILLLILTLFCSCIYYELF
jgi:SSS family solute:Na+ symporter